MASVQNNEPGVFDKIGSWLKRNPEQPAQPAPAPQVASAPEPAPRPRTAAAHPKATPAPRPVTQTASAKPAPAEKPAPHKEAQKEPQPATIAGSTPILGAGGFSTFR
jgi:outer membrane biosynthesis protein TonB